MQATHTAEEMADEDNHSSVLGVIELTERDGLATFVEYLELPGVLKGFLVWFLIARIWFLCHDGINSIDGRVVRYLCQPCVWLEQSSMLHSLYQGGGR